MCSMPSRQKNDANSILIQEWTLSAAATLGSSVRAKGILLEIRAGLSPAVRKLLDIRGSVLVLGMPEGADEEFRAASVAIAGKLEHIDELPVIPREIEDILAITTTERHRWLKDGRLPSAGTRTVKLRGRARKITFHVFDPRKVEDILDADMIATWREDDAAIAAENRRRAAWKAKLTRAQKTGARVSAASERTSDEDVRPKLIGWDEFERDGPLR